DATKLKLKEMGSGSTNAMEVSIWGGRLHFRQVGEFAHSDNEVVFRMPQRTKELDLVSPLEKDKFEAFYVESLKEISHKKEEEFITDTGDDVEINTLWRRVSIVTFDSFHRDESNTFNYPYSHGLPLPHPCFLPVQPYLEDCLVSTNVSDDVDIRSMTIAEYSLYVAKRGLEKNPLNDHSYGFTSYNLEEEEAQVEDGDDGDIYDIWDITVDDIEWIRQFLTPNVPDVMDDVLAARGWDSRVLKRLWMLLEEVDLEHGLEHVVSSSYRAKSRGVQVIKGIGTEKMRKNGNIQQNPHYGRNYGVIDTTDYATKEEEEQLALLLDLGRVRHGIQLEDQEHYITMICT
ncbi:hypothetical protein Tco_0319642, partial [Tanacetum coccineum]